MASQTSQCAHGGCGDNATWLIRRPGAGAGLVADACPEHLSDELAAVAAFLSPVVGWPS